MSRLHSLRATIDDVARFLDAQPVEQIALPPDVTEGRQGLVMFEPHEHARWLHGSIRDVIGFQFRPPIAAERMVVLRTEDAWLGGGPPPDGTQLDLL